MKITCAAFGGIFATLFFCSASANGAVATLGAKFEFSGTLDGSPVSGSIYDGDIHSGVLRDVQAPPSLLSGAALLSDSFVLQGGDPFGGDTGDTFEVSQAPGHAVVSGLDIYTHYGFGNPATQVGTFITGNPDTGYLELVNNTGKRFVGTITLSGQAFGGIYGPAQFFSNSGTVDLSNGDTADIVLNDESSNYGGYNHPDVIPEPATYLAAALLLLPFGIRGFRCLQNGRKSASAKPA